MTDLNLLHEGARHVAARVKNHLPRRLRPGDLYALIPPGPLRQEARAHPLRLLTMLERHGLQATLIGTQCSLSLRATDLPLPPAEEVTSAFWSLHQHLRQTGAPASALRSLHVPLWDLAGEADSTAAGLLLRQVLPCWSPAAIEESLNWRMQAYQTGEAPHYLHWLLHHQSVPAHEVTQLLGSMVRAVGRVMDLPGLPLHAQPALVAAEAGRWQNGVESLNRDSLESLDLEVVFRREGMALPRPLDWTRADQTQPARQQLRAMPGLSEIAEQVQQMLAHAALQARRSQCGLAPVGSNLHMVFTGNPGTGKTTAARLLGQALLEQGVLTSGRVVEVARASLIGAYVGQTAPKVVRAMDDAAGGVLLIDEVHGLLTDPRDSYGREALDTLVKEMEDRRDSLVVVLCGYPREMELLLDANPGLRSRIACTIRFPDYTAPQLLDILRIMAAQHDYDLDAGGHERAEQLLQERIQRGEALQGNARLVRALFEQAVQRQAARLACSPTAAAEAQLSTLTADDFGELRGAAALRA